MKLLCEYCKNETAKKYVVEKHRSRNISAVSTISFTSRDVLMAYFAKMSNVELWCTIQSLDKDTLKKLDFILHHP